MFKTWIEYRIRIISKEIISGWKGRIKMKTLYNNYASVDCTSNGAKNVAEANIN